MTSSFIDKLFARLNRVGPDQVQPILSRLIREKGLLEKVFEALQEGVIILSRDGHATFINRAAGRFFGVDPAQSNGRPLEEIIVGLEAKLLVGGPERSVSRDFEIFYPENRYLNLYSAPIVDSGEAPGTDDDLWLGHVLLIRDLTQTRRVTEEKIESERLNALTLLAAGVAHELGNPLNSLNIHLQLLDRKLRKSSLECYGLVREQLDIARGEIKRLDFIVAQFLSAIRPSRPQLEPEDINQLVHEAARFLEPEIKDRRLNLKLELREDLPLLRVDRGQIKQAVYNLIKNAVQATPPGGRISLRSDFGDYEATISVLDSGAGISAEQMGHLFEPFFTTKSSGTGLGLLIVRRIVREHGGDIEIESTEGKGTRITIRLPFGPRPTRLLPAARSDPASEE
ncbi:MAG: two-component system sensor histidine kinase NtrB [Verrucomicrobiales bacterium]